MFHVEHSVEGRAQLFHVKHSEEGRVQLFHVKHSTEGRVLLFHVKQFPSRSFFPMIFFKIHFKLAWILHVL